MKLRSYSLAAVAASLIVSAAFAQGAPAAKPTAVAESPKAAEMKSKESVVAKTEKTSTVAKATTHGGKKLAMHKKSGQVKSKSGAMTANEPKKEGAEATKVSAVTKAETSGKTAK